MSWYKSSQTDTRTFRGLATFFVDVPKTNDIESDRQVAVDEAINRYANTDLNVIVDSIKTAEEIDRSL